MFKLSTIYYALNTLEIRIAVLTWWALDEIAEAIRPDNLEKIRSAVYKTFVREKVNRVPQKEKDKVKS